jgi:hypothetical protein
MWSSEQTQAHVEAVGGRIAASAPDDLRELLLLVAAVHEERDPISYERRRRSQAPAS